MTIDVNAITQTMMGAVRSVLTDRWPSSRAVVEAELRKLAATFAEIQEMFAEGDTDLGRARTLVRMQENCARSVLHNVEGVSVLTSRRAIAAALSAAATLVNPALGATVILAEQLTSTRTPETPTSRSSGPATKKQKGVVAERATGRAKSTTAASTEPAEETTPGFKAGRDL